VCQALTSTWAAEWRGFAALGDGVVAKTRPTTSRKPSWIPCGRSSGKKLIRHMAVGTQKETQIVDL
jgi:hypothetical protein